MHSFSFLTTFNFHKNKNREQNQFMADHTEEMNNKNQRDECTPCVVVHDNTTKEGGTKMKRMITTVLG